MNAHGQRNSRAPVNNSTLSACPFIRRTTYRKNSPTPSPLPLTFPILMRHELQVDRICMLATTSFSVSLSLSNLMRHEVHTMREARVGQLAECPYVPSCMHIYLTHTATRRHIKKLRRITIYSRRVCRTKRREWWTHACIRACSDH
jgi:hypothetical protein